MHAPPAAKHPPSRILFVSRDPIAHQHGGSTTYALNLLSALTALGAEVTLVVTLAASRSPRPWFRLTTPYPTGIRVQVPGYLRLGDLYLRPWSPHAWARLLLRVAARKYSLEPLAALAKKIFGDGICGYAWDLTRPTAGERALLNKSIQHIQPTTLLANYAYWGDALAELPSTTLRPKRVILMHDLLAARVRSFEARGRELDCPYISETTELRWLNGADTLLAAQQREADAIAAKVRGQVLVLPVTMTPHAPSANPEPGLCLFVGSRIAPNESALTWLLEEVWPLVIAAVPQAKLEVVGAISQVVPQPPPPGVVPLGFQPSIEAPYQRSSVCVVPLIIGSGIKIKLLEALSYGKATVATPVGIEGLEAIASNAVEVASEPQTFAAAIVRLLTDSSARQQLEQRAHALAQQQFDPRRQLDPAFLDAVL